MSEYTKMVEHMECDLYCQLPPKQIVEHCMSMTLIDMKADGCDGPALEAGCGAVWMASHARIFQYAPIVSGDYLTYRTFPRVIEGNRYIYYVEISRGDELVVRFDSSYIPVDKVGRHVLRLSQVEPLWKTPSRTAESRNLRRLRPDVEFTPCGSDTVRCSDCDSNGHMTSGAYFSLACDALGLWESPTPRYIRMIQLDYSSEVRPGTLLEFSRGEVNGLQYLRGVKPDGTPAFTAAVIFVSNTSRLSPAPAAGYNDSGDRK